MDESRLNTIEKIQEFLTASSQISFSVHGDDIERYAHISCVLKRFDYPPGAPSESGYFGEIFDDQVDGVRSGPSFFGYW